MMYFGFLSLDRPLFLLMPSLMVRWSQHHHRNHLTCVHAVQVLPGSQLLASADEQGNIAVKDLRMLGGSSQHAPWPRASPSKAPPAPTRAANTAASHASSGSSWYHSGKWISLPDCQPDHAPKAHSWSPGFHHGNLLYLLQHVLKTDKAVVGVAMFCPETTTCQVKQG